ncbi:MAG: acetone carboxylase subunit gamma [Nevskia sp.]|nr:acetone carboxylase subunit gamma [Nevskia sp.]
MKVPMTEYLEIDLDAELWLCRRCAHKVGSARASYKEGLLVYQRDPREIHKPILDPELYEFTFAPDPTWQQIIEYYCPTCGVMAEVEYLPIGHPPMHDMDFDLDALKQQWSKREPLTEAQLAGPSPSAYERKRHSHKRTPGGR